MGDYTSLGALGGLANLQAIAANLVSANLAQANPLLASSMDLLAANKQVHFPDKRMRIAFLLMDAFVHGCSLVLLSESISKLLADYRCL